MPELNVDDVRGTRNRMTAASGVSSRLQAENEILDNYTFHTGPADPYVIREPLRHPDPLERGHLRGAIPDLRPAGSNDPKVLNRERPLSSPPLVQAEPSYSPPPLVQAEPQFDTSWAPWPKPKPPQKPQSPVKPPRPTAKERGTDNGRPKVSSRTDTDIAISSLPDLGGRTVVEGAVVAPAELAAAERLGAVYLELARIHQTPFGPWAVIPDKGRGQAFSPFYAVLRLIYGSDLERQRKPGNYVSATTAYKRDCDTVMPPVKEAAISFAAQAVKGETTELTKLLNSLGEPGRPAGMHDVSQKVLAAFRREMHEEEARLTGKPATEGRTEEEPAKSYNISYLSEADMRRIVREKISKMVEKTNDEVLQILFQHPDGMKILGAYANSPEKGTAAASARIVNALIAVGKFSEEVLPQGKALRYPFFVMGGVVLRNLSEVPGFAEFAISYCRVLMHDSTETALGAGMAVLALMSLIILGPAGASLLVAYAGLALAAVNLGAAGWSLSLAFARETEQDLANRASRFKGEQGQWATPVIYRDTIFAGAATFLSAIAFFESLNEFRTALSAGALVKPDAPRTPAPAGQRLIANENKATTARANDGAPTADEKLVDRSSSGAVAPEQPAAAGAVKEEQVRATAQDTEAQLSSSAQQSNTQRETQEQTDLPVSNAKPSDPLSDASRMTSRGLPTPEVPNETVTRRGLIEDERANIKAQLKVAKEKLEAEGALLDELRPKKNAAAIERNVAVRKGNKSPDELAELQASAAELDHEFKLHLSDTRAVAEDTLRLQQRLNYTTTDYFDELRAEASTAKAYIAVKKGPLDRAFKPTAGQRSVEHVLPWSKIFQKQGFLSRLSWDQQKFLFLFPRNLKVAPLRFNIRRGVIPYADLPKGFVETYIKPDGELRSLIDIEAEVDHHITLLIENNRDPNIWSRFGFSGSYR